MDRARLRRLPPGDFIGMSAIAHPAAVCQAAAGEVLYLKGSSFPGCGKRGAVHRSPDGVDASRPRLLLKLDSPSLDPPFPRGQGQPHVHAHINCNC